MSSATINLHILAVALLLAIQITMSVAPATQDKLPEIEVCESWGLTNLYYNYFRYKRCTDGVKDLLSKSIDKASILKKSQVLTDMSPDTMIPVIEYFYTTGWDEATMKALVDGLKKSKVMDSNSTATQIKTVVEYMEFAWWKKLLNPNFLNKFELFNVIDVLLAYKGFLPYMQAYYDQLAKANNVTCDTEALMDLFMFIYGFEHTMDKGNLRTMAATDYTDLFKTICDPAYKWNKINLPIMFWSAGLNGMTKDMLKNFMKAVPSRVPDVQRTGYIDSWSLDDISSVVLAANREDETSIGNLLEAIQNVIAVGFLPTRFKDIVSRFQEKQVKNAEDVYKSISLMSESVKKVNKPKIFANKDEPGISDLVFNTHDYHKTVNDWPDTAKSVDRVFTRAVEKNWGVDSMNTGWGALSEAAKMFGKLD